MLKKLLGDLLAMLMIGEGVICLLNPKRHIRLWQFGPSWWREGMELFIRYPHLTRAAGAVEMALGVWLALRQEDEK